MVKKLFWKPHKVSSRVLAAIAFLVAVAYVLAFSGLFNWTTKDDLRMQAARTTGQAFDVIRRARETPIDARNDPTRSGLIGVKDSPITSKWGKLEAKQTTVNPNWAAVFVELYRESGLRPGDAVVLGVSGSFPTMNAAAIIAAETMNLHPVVISSVLSSQWGANDPDFTWLDMERLLFEAGVIKTRSVVASIGGKRDRAAGMPPETVELAREIIQRNGIPMLETEKVSEAVEARLQWIQNTIGSTKPRAYVNIGGGQASLGGKDGRKAFQPGINEALDEEALANMEGPASVARAVMQGGGVFINITGIQELAKRYGLPWRPKVTPPPGEGGVFVDQSPRLQAAMILVALFGMVFFARYRFRLGKESEQVTVAAAPVIEPSRTVLH